MTMRRAAHIGGDAYLQPTNEMLEEENQRLEGKLANQVSTLKTLTIDIGNEVRSQNNMLGEMDDDFESSGGLLGKTMGRLKKLSRSGNYKIMFYLILFTLFVFLVCWMVIKFR